MTDISESPVLTIEPVVVPETLEQPEARRFLDMVRIANEVCRHDAGHDYLREEPEEMLGFWQDQSDWTQVGYAVLRDDVMVGAVKLMISNEPGTSAIEFDLMVDPPHWGIGAEELLLAEVEREARERRIGVIQTWTLHRPDAGRERLEPPTGWGSIPADDRQTVFQLRNGFSLEQVERNSVFDLTKDVAPLRAMLEDAVRTAGQEYRVISWTAPTPPEYADGFANAMARMSTDAPSAGMVIDEQHWDAARVQRRDARQQAQGLTVSVAAVFHEPTGAIAAYNELVIADDPRGATQQFGTLVLKEHRGRRLGTVVKCANLLRWRDIVPESPRVSTFNAEENRHMLDINEAIGFVPASYAGAWKKVIEL
ncbi:GNAT family N-acetyltransferase [Microbacterium yannicii]|uniref:GNAT family N-acetyltransferase n=1 Tax=Microbacterium yannicii TaxID=671622 RepID=UPI0002FBC3EE|nr:GNAT family N-acetyltransferase [Microbacterium yannicii]